MNALYTIHSEYCTLSHANCTLLHANCTLYTQKLVSHCTLHSEVYSTRGFGVEDWEGVLGEMDECYLGEKWRTYTWWEGVGRHSDAS